MSFAVTAFRKRIGVTVTGPRHDDLTSPWDGMRAETSGVVDARVRITSGRGEGDWVAAALTSGITTRLLESVAGELLLFHAAGLADDEGDVTLLVAASGRGKTTAARVLGRTRGYVTDETVAVDDLADDAVLPYRKPLSIAVTPGRPKAQLSPDVLGLRPLPATRLRASRVVLLSRDVAHTGPAVLSPVGLVDSIVELVPQMSYLGLTEGALRRLAGLIERTGGAMRIRYRDAEEIGDVLDRAGSGESTTTWRPVPWESRTPGIEFGEAVDAIATDESTLVLTRERLLVLGGIAPAILDAVARGVPIADSVARHHGEPHDAERLIALRLGELVEAGVLRHG